jgi:hypothetical protein
MRLTSLVLLSIAVTPILGQLPEDLERQVDQAEQRILRLPPTAFPELPRNVVKELIRRGCTIPQEAFTKATIPATASAKTQRNIVRGAFAKPGQTDWAVLCSVKGISTILVFWNGSEKNPAELAPLEDRIFLQGVGIGEDQFVFSRGIVPVQNDFIVIHYKAHAGPKPPTIDHQGIEDAFIGKASVVWYFHEGNWLKLAGAD